ncbi:hypothetical protein GGS21DRAFT_507334 [Xylaria nigripes]|nr:hypothetical protein GGS21DRAFT_507334 [Xylaria nigripes]
MVPLTLFGHMLVKVFCQYVYPLTAASLLRQNRCVFDMQCRVPTSSCPLHGTFVVLRGNVFTLSEYLPTCIP